MQEPRENDTHAGVPFVLGRQHALHHVLARATVPKADGEESRKDTGEWELGMVGGQEYLKLVRHFLGQPGHAADLPERQNGNENPGHEKQQHLQEVGPSRRFQAAVDRVRPRDDGEKDNAPLDVRPGSVCEPQVEDALECQAAGEQRSGHDRGDVADHKRHGEDVAARRIESPLEKLRHRVQAGADVIRQEDQDQDRVDDPTVPRPGRGNDAVLVGDADVHDEVFAGDVGRDHAGADDVPWHCAVAEEVILRLAADVAGDGEAEHERGRQVNKEDGVIDRVQGRLAAHEAPPVADAPGSPGGATIAAASLAWDAADILPVAGSIASAFAGPPICGMPFTTGDRSTVWPKARSSSMTESETGGDTATGSAASTCTRPALTAAAGVARKSMRLTISWAVSVTILVP